MSHNRRLTTVQRLKIYTPRYDKAHYFTYYFSPSIYSVGEYAHDQLDGDNMEFFRELWYIFDLIKQQKRSCCLLAGCTHEQRQ